MSKDILKESLQTSKQETNKPNGYRSAVLSQDCVLILNTRSSLNKGLGLDWYIKTLIEMRASISSYTTQPGFISSFPRASCHPAVSSLVPTQFVREFTSFHQKASRAPHDPSQGPPPAAESSSSAVRAFDALDP